MRLARASHIYDIPYLIHKLIGQVIVFVIDESDSQRKSENNFAFIDLRNGINASIPVLRFKERDLRSIRADIWNPWIGTALR